MDSAQLEVKALIDRRSDAIRAKDIDRLLAVYSPDIVYFDLVPPLRYVGITALRGRFLDWFEGWQSSIRQDVRDIQVVASGEVAAAHMLIQAGGTRKDGQEVGFWVRASNAFRLSDRGWLITHEHISLPVDVRTRTAAMDLVP
jgi:ketosteroid isomerase-like protein